MVLSKGKITSALHSSARLPDLLILQTQVQDSDHLRFEKQEISATTLGKALKLRRDQQGEKKGQNLTACKVSLNPQEPLTGIDWVAPVLLISTN